MLACATAGALHATIASVEITASAQVETMGGVGAEKTAIGHLRNQHGFSLVMIIQLPAAFQLGQIRNAYVIMAVIAVSDAQLVDGWQPFQMTIADQGVATE